MDDILSRVCFFCVLFTVGNIWASLCTDRLFDLFRMENACSFGCCLLFGHDNASLNAPGDYIFIRLAIRDSKTLGKKTTVCCQVQWGCQILGIQDVRHKNRRSKVVPVCANSCAFRPHRPGLSSICPCGINCCRLGFTCRLGLSLATLNWYAQIRIISKRFGFHNYSWSKTNPGITARMAVSQIKVFMMFLVKEGRLTRAEMEKLVLGKNAGIALMDAWDRLKWIANKNYRFNLQDAVFSEGGIAWEKLQKLTWHPATFNDPIVFFLLEEAIRSVDIPQVLTLDKNDRSTGQAAITKEEVNQLGEAEKQLFLTYYTLITTPTGDEAWGRKNRSVFERC